MGSCGKTRLNTRVSGYVSHALARDVRQLAREEGVSQSEVIRAALTQTAPGQIRSACRLALFQPHALRASVLTPSKGSGALGGYVGRATEVLIDGPSCLERLPATWRLVEADRLITSHTHDFKVDPRYPQGVQERDYSADKGEQLKVIRNSGEECFAPALIFNTSPGSTDGTSVCLPSGVCLSGNSRGIVVMRVYLQGNAALKRLQDYLSGWAEVFGFDPGWLSDFKRPSIVRVLENEGRASRRRLADLVRRFNEPLTLSLSPVREQVAQANKLLPEDLELVRPEVGQTLNAWLQTEDASSFIQTLQRRGVLSKASSPQYFSGSKLNSQGRAYAIRVLAGALVPSPDLLERAGASLRDQLAQSAPAILEADRTAKEGGAAGQGWEVASRLPAALRLRERVQASSSAARAEDLRKQGDIEGQAALDPLTEQIANALLRKPRGQRGGWAKWLALVKAQLQPSLFAPAPLTPAEAISRAFGLPRWRE